MIIPFLNGDNFGFSRFYCSYRYSHEIDNNGYGKERSETKGWRITLVIIIIFNVFINLYFLIKTHRFYSDKLITLKQQNKNEYRSLKIFVWVFRIFPIVIFVSRLYKSFANILVSIFDKNEKEYDKTPIYIIQYINNFIFASNGIFLSIASLIFFRGIFTSCSSNSNERSQSMSSKIDMKFLNEENDDD